MFNEKTLFTNAWRVMKTEVSYVQYWYFGSSKNQLLLNIFGVSPRMGVCHAE